MGYYAVESPCSRCGGDGTVMVEEDRIKERDCTYFSRFLHQCGQILDAWGGYLVGLALVFFLVTIALLLLNLSLLIFMLIDELLYLNASILNVESEEARR